ncbi:hypothetical protein L596_000959 [Steinernema carpocapsae]|uniref:Uncharacterized protein n=1 Tax=Steinernema carpocapsae TaxID=34508 RepID=A0A4U8UK12_STECR|nr:hypothetical protein L596_000959 [Steinernema carpocapsae]
MMSATTASGACTIPALMSWMRSCDQPEPIDLLTFVGSFHECYSLTQKTKIKTPKKSECQIVLNFYCALQIERLETTTKISINSFETSCFPFCIGTSIVKNLIS